MLKPILQPQERFKYQEKSIPRPSLMIVHSHLTLCNGSVLKPPYNFYAKPNTPPLASSSADQPPSFISLTNFLLFASNISISLSHRPSSSTSTLPPLQNQPFLVLPSVCCFPRCCSCATINFQFCMLERRHSVQRWRAVIISREDVWLPDGVGRRADEGVRLDGEPGGGVDK